jgi:hypothetical protein
MSNGGMIFTRESEELGEEPVPVPLRSEKPATNLLSYGRTLNHVMLSVRAKRVLANTVSCNRVLMFQTERLVQYARNSGISVSVPDPGASSPNNKDK